MSEKIVTLNEEVIKGEIRELVRGSVEETLNNLLEAEADRLTQAARYERSEDRQGYRSGHYDRNLTTTSGEVTLHVPRLKGISFETAIIERYRRRESSVEEALIEMYLAGVSVRRVEDITEALWGSRVSPSTISELNKKAYVNIENWRKRPLTGRYPYVYVDGIYLKRNWGGEYENVSILVAVGVAEDGYREVLGAQEGMKEDKASWQSFFKWLKGRGLDGVRLVVGDKCLGMLEAVGEVFPEAKYQRCIVHFYRNVFTVTPRGKMRDVTHMLKAIHAQETREAAREKAQAVVQKLREMRLKEAAKKVEDGIEETLNEGAVANLQNAFSELTAQFSLMRAASAHREEEMTHFVENIAHQIKNAATALQIRLDILQMKLKLPDEVEALKKSQLCMNRLTDEVDRVLKSSQLASGKITMVPEKIDLSEAIKECCDELSPLAEARSVELLFEPKNSICISADAFWLPQAISNIIKNAVEHTARGTAVNVIIKDCIQNIEVRIEDHGAGIPEDELPLMFERFHRGAAAKAGYGIGLSMANDIVRAHHGSIRVVNMQTGAAFTITLPVLDGIKPYLDAEGD